VSSPSARPHSALRNPQFRLLWGGSLCAFIAFFTSNIVQQVVAFELTGQNRAVGLVVLGRGLAQITLGPIGGALADRISKRTILVVCQSFTTLVFLGLAYLMWSGRMEVMHLVVGGFLVGVTFAFLGPTRQAYVVDIVSAERRGNAVALNQVALNVSRVVGPAAAGALLAWPLTGATGAFLFMAALYLVALALQSGLPPTGQPDPEARGLLSDLLEGLGYVRDNPRLRTLVAMFVLVVMLGFPYVTVLPGLCENQLGVDAKAVSMLFSAGAGGGLLASLLMTRVADSRWALTVYRAGGLTFGASLWLLYLSTNTLTATLAMLVVGFTSGCFTTLHGAVILRSTDPRYMGRVMSLGMLAFGAFGLISVPVGMAADRFGEGAVLAVMGSVVCLVVVVLGAVLARTPEPPAQV
jgi:MFS family permease